MRSHSAHLIPANVLERSAFTLAHALDSAETQSCSGPTEPLRRAVHHRYAGDQAPVDEASLGPPCAGPFLCLCAGSSAVEGLGALVHRTWPYIPTPAEQATGTRAQKNKPAQGRCCWRTFCAGSGPVDPGTNMLVGAIGREPLCQGVGAGIGGCTQCSDMHSPTGMTSKFPDQFPSLRGIPVRPTRYQSPQSPLQFPATSPWFYRALQQSRRAAGLSNPFAQWLRTHLH